MDPVVTILIGDDFHLNSRMVRRVYTHVSQFKFDLIICTATITCSICP